MWIIIFVKKGTQIWMLKMYNKSLFRLCFLRKLFHCSKIIVINYLRNNSPWFHLEARKEILSNATNEEPLLIPNCDAKRDRLSHRRY